MVAAMQAGVQLDYGDPVAGDIGNALAQGQLKETVLDAAVARSLLTRFRLGEFDEAPRNPFLKRV